VPNERGHNQNEIEIALSIFISNFRRRFSPFSFDFQYSAISFFYGNEKLFFLLKYWRIPRRLEMYSRYKYNQLMWSLLSMKCDHIWGRNSNILFPFQIDSQISRKEKFLWIGKMFHLHKFYRFDKLSKKKDYEKCMAISSAFDCFCRWKSSKWTFRLNFSTWTFPHFFGGSEVKWRGRFTTYWFGRWWRDVLMDLLVRMWLMGNLIELLCFWRFIRSFWSPWHVVRGLEIFH
jgi:hypothetical protein